MRGVLGFASLVRASRWILCRLLRRVLAVLGLREVGVLGLEREGIFFFGCRRVVGLGVGEWVEGVEADVVVE